MQKKKQQVLKEDRAEMHFTKQVKPCPAHHSTRHVYFNWFLGVFLTIKLYFTHGTFRMCICYQTESQSGQTCH